MDFSKVIRERYSCRDFDTRRIISEQQLEEILEAGRLAPTAKNLQEQHIYVAQSQEALAVIDRHCSCRFGATTVLVVTWDKNNVYHYHDSERDSGAEDATIVATHMMLAAHNCGVDSCWLNSFNPSALATDLHLPENEEILMMLDLGFATEDAKPAPRHSQRKPIEETVTRI